LLKNPPQELKQERKTKFQKSAPAETSAPLQTKTFDQEKRKEMKEEMKDLIPHTDLLGIAFATLSEDLNNGPWTLDSSHNTFTPPKKRKRKKKQPQGSPQSTEELHSQSCSTRRPENYGVWIRM